jgi:Trk K+ transport system NAD-binding subunit
MDVSTSLIVVCGLGGLGQACVRTLLYFNAPLRCLDLTPPLWIQDDALRAVAAGLVIGDMRQPESLLQAGVRDARAVLLLSSDSGVNLEAALQVRLLNGTTRVVVRSNGSRGLERHLRERLPGVVMVDPELLTAGVFAHALHREGSEAAFTDQGERFQVHRQEISMDSQEDLHTLQQRQRRLLQWCPADQSPIGPPASQWWDLEGKPRSGDQLFWLEAVSTPLSRARRGRNGWREAGSRLQLAREAFQDIFVKGLSRSNPGFLLGVGLLVLVLAVGSDRFGFGSPLRGLLLTIALLKGEYIDALSAMTGGGTITSERLPLASFSLAIALGGTLFTAWLVAVILDWLLSRRLGRREPPPPTRGASYALLIGGRRLAHRLENLLLATRLAVVRVQSEREDGAGLAFASLERAKRVLRHGRCQAVAVLGDDLMANLETALHLQDLWPQARLAVQSHSQSPAAGLSRLFPGIEVVNPLELAAEAVVATAFGERVREVMRVAETNLLLTDYRVEAQDSLVGRSLGQIAEGYGVMPVSLLSAGQRLTMPGLDRVLRQGDALLVLASLPGLRAVESGRMRLPAWRLELRGVGAGADMFAAQMLLARHLNCPPGEVAPYLDPQKRPRATPPLPQGQGRELQTSLRRLGIHCELIPAADLSRWNDLP